jgi:outer membrane protein, heavy metal efflux system
MNVVPWLTAAFVLAASVAATAQHTPELAPAPPIALADLLIEAEANNPSIAAADHSALAARQMVPQVTTLPDPKLAYQQLSVGSPKPFAGYSNSDFAYIGLGASQELPYPGKLRLRGEVAGRDADTKQALAGMTRAEIDGQVKSAYLQLAFLQQTLTLLRENETVLDQLIQDAMAHYQVGQGMQQDVLEAQLDRTKIVKEVTMHHQQMGLLQAQIKGLLHRDQTSPDITPEDLTEHPLTTSAANLLALLRKGNPQLAVDTKDIDKQNAQVASAKRERKPDFEVGYMYQNTDRKYRDYYMLSFDVSFPRRKRVDAEVAQAQEQLIASQKSLDAHTQERLADAQQEYVKVQSDEELLKELSDGLIPQSDAAYRATISAYSFNRDTSTHVLQGFRSLLDLKLEYAETLLEHESALARLETLTGATLR